MKTQRLIIRPLTINDVNDYLEMQNSEFVLRYNAMEHINRDEVAKLIEEKSNDQLIFGIEHIKDQKLIGVVDFEQDDLRYRLNSLCLSYFLNEKYVQNGYMFEALMPIIKNVFETTNTDIICARSFKENIASQKLLIKLGFVHEGTLRRAVKGYNEIIYDDLIYSLFKEEF